MKISTQKSSRSAQIRSLTGLGIFATSLLVTASAVYLYSPVIKSHADSATDTATSEVSAEIAPVVSLTLDTNNLNFSIIPTDSGVFESKSIVATVNTNSTGGYELYFSSVDGATNMVHTNSSITDVIASDFNGTVTSSTMAKNKWGYSLDNTDFSKIPTLANQVKIKDLDHFPVVAERSTTVHIGTKIASDLKAGRYAKSVLFSATAHAVPEPDPTMQTFDKTTLANVGDSATLEDERDGNSYVVKKLADGNVWMTSNLKLANKALTSDDSDLPSGVTYTVPASNVSDFTTAYNTDAAYIDTTYGGYYNFYTATAGWGTNSVTSGDSPRSICPKGWRLPTTTEFQTLYSSYNSSALMRGEPGFVLSGDVNDGSVNNQGSLGFYWSSSVYNANLAYSLYLNASDVDPGHYNYKYYGFSVRCVAR